MEPEEFLREPFPRLLALSVTLALGGLTLWAFPTYNDSVPFRDEAGAVVGWTMLGQLSFGILCVGTPLLHCVAFGWASLVTRKQPVGCGWGIPICAAALLVTWAVGCLAPLRTPGPPAQVGGSVCDPWAATTAGTTSSSSVSFSDGALTRGGQLPEPIQLAAGPKTQLFLRPIFRCDGRAGCGREVCAWAIDTKPPALPSDCGTVCGKPVTLGEITRCGGECDDLERALRPYMALHLETLGIAPQSAAFLGSGSAPSSFLQLTAKDPGLAWAERMYWLSATVLTIPAMLVVVLVVLSQFLSDHGYTLAGRNGRSPKELA